MRYTTQGYNLITMLLDTIDGFTFHVGVPHHDLMVNACREEKHVIRVESKGKNRLSMSFVNTSLKTCDSVPEDDFMIKRTSC